MSHSNFYKSAIGNGQERFSEIKELRCNFMTLTGTYGLSVTTFFLI